MAIQHKTITSLPNVNIKGGFETPITGVSIDTRSLNAGDLFVAFIGSQVDGHDFIPKAISRGASAVMASTSWDGCEAWEAHIPLIMTDDPIKSLADLATAHRKLFDIPLIAITGTNGKTSSKNLLSHILGKRYTVLSTEGNFNNHIGLPITLLNLNESHDMAVIEMGASQKGDIKYLCDIAQPNQGLITNISLAHTEFFHDIDTIQSTKGELFEYLGKNAGRAFVNIDDPRVLELAENCTNSVHYGFGKECEHHFRLAGPDNQGNYDIQILKFSAHLNQAGKAIALNAAAASAIALHNGIRYDELQSALEDYPGEAGRMQHEQVGEIHFYNDAYNSNPASTQAGFETISEMQISGRKVLIFADMLELGSLSTEAHANAGKQIIDAGFDVAILVGTETQHTTDSLNKQDFNTLFYSADKAEATKYFLENIRAGDLVYLKGSRGMQLETFIEAYKENK